MGGLKLFQVIYDYLRHESPKKNRCVQDQSLAVRSTQITTNYFSWLVLKDRGHLGPGCWWEWPLCDQRALAFADRLRHNHKIHSQGLFGLRITPFATIWEFKFKNCLQVGPWRKWSVRHRIRHTSPSQARRFGRHAGTRRYQTHWSNATIWVLQRSVQTYPNGAVEMFFSRGTPPAKLHQLWPALIVGSLQARRGGREEWPSSFVPVVCPLAMPTGCVGKCNWFVRSDPSAHCLDAQSIWISWKRSRRRVGRLWSHVRSWCAWPSRWRRRGHQTVPSRIDDSSNWRIAKSNLIRTCATLLVSKWTCFTTSVWWRPQNGTAVGDGVRGTEPYCGGFWWSQSAPRVKLVDGDLGKKAAPKEAAPGGRWWGRWRLGDCFLVVKVVRSPSSALWCSDVFWLQMILPVFVPVAFGPKTEEPTFDWGSLK